MPYVWCDLGNPGFQLDLYSLDGRSIYSARVYTVDGFGHGYTITKQGQNQPLIMGSRPLDLDQIKAECEVILQALCAEDGSLPEPGPHEP